MPNPNKYSNKRIKYVDKSITELSQEAQNLQRSLWDIYIDQVMLSLHAKGKVIQDTPENRDIINSLGQLIDGDLRPFDGKKFLEWYVNRMDGLGELNQKYFGETIGASSETIGKFAETNRKQLLEMLGVVNGKIKKGSFIYNLIDFGPVYNKLQGGLITTIFTGQPYDLKGVKEYVIGSNGQGLKGKKTKAQKGEAATATNRSGGAIEGAINGKTFDTFQGYDRNIQKGMANDLNLEYAIYQGGLIKTSREFCIERNDRVFSTEEIEKFGTSADAYGGYTDKATGEFDGKSEPYNPFTNLGGWNCRHHLDYISDELAALLLKDQKKESAVVQVVPVVSPKPTVIKQKVPKPKVDPPFTPKNIAIWEKEFNVKIDRSLFGLLNSEIVLSDKNAPGYRDPGAYFLRPGFVRIPFSDKYKSTWNGEKIFYHEFGHAIDHQRQIFRSEPLLKIFKKHQNDYTKAYYKLEQLNRWAYRRGNKYREMNDQIGALRDTMESLDKYLSKNGQMHSKSYWKREGSKEKEFIAHMFENKFIGNKWFKKYLPELYQDMIDFKLE